MASERTSRTQVSHPQWSDVRDLLHLRLKDAAALLKSNTIYLRRICRQNGFPHWPGKKIRYLNATGKKFKLEEISNTNKMTDEDMIRIHEPVLTNHAPGELTTLNLIDKIGLESSGK
ncbi:unnamed protein product [Urochloa decumbens]|uniref:RWP-RK domain-containing protein n=1 Tax=Urochloa decumbens TaxID=240449 RepID=A0ABC9BSX6_9POAL